MEESSLPAWVQGTHSVSASSMTCAKLYGRLLTQTRETLSSKQGSSKSPREAVLQEVWLFSTTVMLKRLQKQVPFPCWGSLPPRHLIEEEDVQLGGEERQAPGPSSCARPTDLCLSHLGTVISVFLSS